MLTDEELSWIEARINASVWSVAVTKGHALELLRVYRAVQSGAWVLVPKEPVTEQLRALIKHRGYDPDANENTLDGLGQLDVMTMGAFVAAYKVMLAAAPELEKP